MTTNIARLRLRERRSTAVSPPTASNDRRGIETRSDGETATERGGEMRSSRRRFLRLAGASAVATVGASRTVTAQERPVVEMRNNYFDPIGLHVEPGTTVTFELAAGAHSATAYEDRLPDGADSFDSGTISSGVFRHTFETPGTYDYYCIPHKTIGMVGRVVVGEPGGPAERTPIPDGDVPESAAIVERGVVPYDEFVDDGGGDRQGSGGVMGPGRMNGGGGPCHDGAMGPGMTNRGGTRTTNDSWWPENGALGGVLGTTGLVAAAAYRLLGGD